MSFTRVAAVADLPSNSRKAFVVNGKSILLCNVAGQRFAIANQCSHNDKPLERGRLGNGTITCPTHGARFDLATGKPLCLPATQPIQVFELRVVDDWIEVLVPDAAAVAASS